MFVRKMIMAIVLVSSFGTTSWAESGTQEEQAACRADVRRFCAKLPRGASDGDYRSCLQAHREKLGPKCVAVLTSHGQ